MKKIRKLDGIQYSQKIFSRQDFAPHLTRTIDWCLWLFSSALKSVVSKNENIPEIDVTNFHKSYLLNFQLSNLKSQF